VDEFKPLPHARRREQGAASARQQYQGLGERGERGGRGGAPGAAPTA